MNLPEHISLKVDAALDSLDNIQRAKANPFLYTRIRAAMGNTPEPHWVIKLFLKPSVAVSAAALIGLLNIMVLLPERKEDSLAVKNDEELSFTAAYHDSRTGDENIYSLLDEEQP